MEAWQLELFRLLLHRDGDGYSLSVPKRLNAAMTRSDSLERLSWKCQFRQSRLREDLTVWSTWPGTHGQNVGT
jgi:hypothetical protein